MIANSISRSGWPLSLKRTVLSTRIACSNPTQGIEVSVHLSKMTCEDRGLKIADPLSKEACLNVGFIKPV
jgi:hypothetical protein